MQLRDGRNPGSLRAALAAIAVLMLAALACLMGCGNNGGRTTRFLVVSDADNNRILIYNAKFSNGQSANVVLGQASFTTNTAGLSATGMDGPSNAAQDSAGNLYVADHLNYRVLQFKPPFTNDMSASLAIGQPDLVTGAPNTTQKGFGANPANGFVGGPIGMAFDSSGNLWVVDFSNHRILQFKPPFATGMNASVVIGQANFISSVAATTNSGLTGPEFMALDGSGNLWVADTFNNRVLEFKPPFANGMAASLVIGQTDFVSSGAATTASGLDFPTGVAFDRNGNLWIADTDNSRVLQFKPPFANGMSASLVLGQANFTTNTTATTENGLFRPFGLGFDSSGDLGVADTHNNRMMGFKTPFSNNQNANLVLGQPDFATSTAATTAAGQEFPFAVLAAF